MLFLLFFCFVDWIINIIPSVSHLCTTFEPISELTRIDCATCYACTDKVVSTGITRIPVLSSEELKRYSKVL